MMIETSSMRAVFDEKRGAFCSLLGWDGKSAGNGDWAPDFPREGKTGEDGKPAGFGRGAETGGKPEPEQGSGLGRETEFLLTPEEFPEYDVQDARWLGNLFLTIEKNGVREEMNTGASEDIRRIDSADRRIIVDFPADSGNPGGIRGIRVKEVFDIRPEGIFWEIELENPEDEPLCLKKLGIPLLMNQYFRGGNEQKYEECVLRHTCVAHHHSYVYWSKSSGGMPILLFQALGNTPLVHFSCEKEDPVFGRQGSMKGAFEGGFHVYPVHEETEYSHLPGEVLELKSGERKVLRFYLGIVNSFEEMEARLIRNGGIAVKALPGMCVPKEEEVLLLIRSSLKPQVCCQEEGDSCGEATAGADRGPEKASGGNHKPEAVTKGEERGSEKDSGGNYVPEAVTKGADRTAEGSADSGDTWIARVRFGGCGIRNLWIKTDHTVMKLRFFAMEPIHEMIQKQAEFIAEKQFETDPEDPCYHGLLMWDMTVKHRINKSCNPYGPNWFAGGSDEIGLVSGLFLSEKNRYLPDESQIRVLDGYVRDFLEKRLTEQPGYKVHRMVPWFEMFEPWAGYGADDAWRAFNYVHVINTFCNMYDMASKYGYDFLERPSHYATQAYQYMKAMFTYWMFPEGVGATEYGNMGEGMMALTLGEILEKEGMTEEADWVRKTVRKKGSYFASQEYPYGSEMAYDSTAFEAVYAYGKAIGDRRVMEMTMRVACANRGKQPVWYLYQTDLRQMGDSSWNVSYMTQLGAYPMYDWLFVSGLAEESASLAEIWYASYLAGWSVYNSGGFWSADPENSGASGWIVDGDMGRFSGMADQHSPYLKGLVPMSGESALGYYGALKIAGCAVLDHPVAGRYGFGCRLTEEEGKECIVPGDGLGIRVCHLADGWSLELDRDSIRRIVKDGEKLRLSVTNYTKDRHILNVTFRYNGTVKTQRFELEEAGDQDITIPFTHSEQI